MRSLSYSATVKDFLCKKTAYEVGLESVSPDALSKRCSKCCSLAFFYGAVLFSKRLKTDTMTLSIENERLLEICTYIMIQNFLATPRVVQTGRGDKTRFEVTFGRDLLGHELGERMNDEEGDFSFACRCESCTEYFVRGAFLSAGVLCDPRLDYRVEFLLRDRRTAELFADFLGDDFAPKITKRRAEHVLYIKGSERVMSFFTAIGAQTVSLDIMEKSIEKETMGALNRSCNCETANMKKTVNASVAIRLAISKLRESGKFASLPDDLKETALLRERHPEATLAELSRLSEGGISKSGINHRLKRIIEISEE